MAKCVKYKPASSILMPATVAVQTLPLPARVTLSYPPHKVPEEAPSWHWQVTPPYNKYIFSRPSINAKLFYNFPFRSNVLILAGISDRWLIFAFRFLLPAYVQCTIHFVQWSLSQALELWYSLLSSKKKLFLSIYSIILLDRRFSGMTGFFAFSHQLFSYF